MAENDASEPTVSLDEVLEHNTAMEAEARAVLGDSDSKNCTYPKGALPRQAVFACATCTPIRMPGVKTAGFCLACSLVCHGGHEVFELYTKRDFRCDCGNSRLSDVRCRLCPDKDAENESNVYNHNFLGLYCTCGRPYPDNEAKDDSIVDDDMLQCIVCEDWYHERHLGHPVPEEYGEMVCDSCVKRCPFLFYYSLAGPGHDSKAPTSTATDTEASQNEATTGDSAAGEPAAGTAKPSGAQSGEAAVKPESADSSYESLEVGCDLAARKSSWEGDVVEKAAFFEEGWRAELCTCAKCLVLCEELNVTFLLDITDTTAAYEERGRANSPSAGSTASLEEQGMHALSGLPRVAQVELNTEYVNMRQELSAFLRPFAEAGKVVSDEDIHRFFGQLRDRKRRPGDGMPPGGCGMP